MNKKKIFQYILIFFAAAVLISIFEDSTMAALILIAVLVYWSISNIEKTYNANFDNIATQNHELSEKVMLLEMEINDLKDQIRFLKNDISNIEHDISPFVHRFNDD